jgi:hypothetical protein
MLLVLGEGALAAGRAYRSLHVRVSGFRSLYAFEDQLVTALPSACTSRPVKAAQETQACPLTVSGIFVMHTKLLGCTGRLGCVTASDH